MADTNEFPRLLYKQDPDGPHEVWGHKVELRTVADADEQADAQKHGFKLRPDGHDTEPKPAKAEHKPAAPVAGTPVSKDPAPDA